MFGNYKLISPKITSLYMRLKELKMDTNIALVLDFVHIYKRYGKTMHRHRIHIKLSETQYAYSLGWRIMTPENSLVTKVYKAKYFANLSFLEAGIGRRPSHAWRSILWEREVLEKGMIWRIGNGLSTKIYEDNWLPGKTSLKVYSPISLDQNAKVAELLATPFTWNKVLICQHLLPDEATKICNVLIGGPDTQDGIAWAFSKDGVYTVKSGYWIARSLNPLSGKKGEASNMDLMNWNAKLWSLQLPDKVKLFCWRACHNVIPTAHALWKRHVASTSHCLICGYGCETVFPAL